MSLINRIIRGAKQGAPSNATRGAAGRRGTGTSRRSTPGGGPTRGAGGLGGMARRLLRRR